MSPKVPFVGREKEITRIHDLVYGTDTNYVLGIQGDGGIGKTRLLDFVSNTLMKDTSLKVIQVVDFDSIEFQIDDVINFLITISKNFDKENFRNFSLALSDYQTELHDTIHDFRAWEKKVESLKESFIRDFNAHARNQRIVIFIDTAEKFRNLQSISSYLKEFISFSENTLFVISGRYKKHLNEWFVKLDSNRVEKITLSRFSDEESAQYLQAKEVILKNQFSPNLKEKILLLARGLPILIDLSLEWLSRDVPFSWLQEVNMSQFESLSSEEREREEALFESQLVTPVAEMRKPLNSLTLLLSEIYPVDENWIQVLLSLSTEEARELIKKAKTYVFVKSLKDGRITLHDEMRRMVEEYVWPEIDSDGGRRRRDSREIVRYLDQQIAKIESSSGLRNTQGLVYISDFDASEIGLQLLRINKVKHLFVFDVEQAIDVFKGYFDMAKGMGQYTFADALLDAVEPQLNTLSANQSFEVYLRKAQYLMLLGRKERYVALNVLDSIPNRNSLPIKAQFEILNQQGHITVRIGDVRKAIAKFRKAESLSQKHQLTRNTIRIKNALGWAYRIMGDRKSAIQLYREAKGLCLDEGEYGKAYCQTLTNLSFILSYHDRKSAIGLGNLALDSWKELNNSLGVAQSTSSLGCIYYQARFYERAAELLDEALVMFEKQTLLGWAGTVHSWKGALLQDIGQYGDAEYHLRMSLNLAPEQDSAMTLNRLGRVYMSRKEWDTAEEYMHESYRVAQEIPDYVYWLGSLARLITIAAERKQVDLIGEFQQMLSEFDEVCPFPDRNSQGIAYFAMARLALGKKDVQLAMKYLETAILDVVEYGSYAHTDVRVRLNYVEKDFVSLGEETIREMGEQLRKVFQEKVNTNASYDVVTLRLHKWEKWQSQQGALHN